MMYVFVDIDRIERGSSYYSKHIVTLMDRCYVENR